MFGYIKPQIPELKVKEFELYKATYCGLCRTMGKTTGCVSKMTLNYDFVFLVLLRKVAEKRTGEIKMRRCIVHPFKKRPMLEIDSTLEYCAKTSVMLTKLKLKDNVNDTHGFKRLLAKIVALVSVFFKKTDKNLTSLEALLKEKIDALGALEAQECDSVDSVSSIFGELLGAVASYGLDGEIATLCTKIGYHLGKWIYVIDAIDDLEDDAKSHSFNPIINAFGATLTDEDKDILRLSLMLELDEMSKSVEALDFSAHRDVEGIIKNTIYVGMVNQVNRVLKLKTV
ncbi:MAG: hypothetical protein IJF11_04890 [Clostridia bacterium]|nr:hypothetical protein [Clostridia bacterium]